MKRKEKNKKIFFTKRRIIFSLAFLFCAFFAFSSDKANAAAVTNCCSADQINTCTNLIANGIGGQGANDNAASCNPNAETQTNGLITKCLLGKHGKTGCNASGKIGQAVCAGGISNVCKEDESKVKQVNQITAEQARANQEKARSNPNTCGLTNIGACFVWAFNVLLYAAFLLVKTLLWIAAILFDVMVNVKIFTAMMGLPAVEAGWKLVRDLLNMFFILVLLFSAFCTIFQVDKFNIKKILLTLVIMALLVNFSFPISRFIIDAANIPMYYFFKVIANSASNGSGGTISSSIMGETGIQKLLLPGTDSMSQVGSSWEMSFQIIAAIVFGIIFAITLLVIGVLLLIRVVVLVILVIFSPVGFVGAILPSFGKFSNDWWESLFKQSFFGPVMAFMLYIALFMMTGVQQSINGILEGAAQKSIAQTGSFHSVVVSGLSLAIPIILLWAAIIVGKQMGGKTASIGMGLLNKAKNFGWKMTKAGAKATGIPGGVKQAVDHYKKKGFPGLRKVPGFRGSEATENLESKWGGLFKQGPEGWNKAKVEKERERANEKRKKWKDQGGATADELQKALDKKDSNPGDAKASALEMAEKNGFKNLKQYQQALDAVKDDKVLKNQFDDKVKEKHIKFVIEDKIQKGITKANDTRTKRGLPVLTAAEEDGVKRAHYKTELSKMGADKIAKQDKLLGDSDFKRFFLDDLNTNDRPFLTKVASKVDRRYRKLWKEGYGYRI